MKKENQAVIEGLRPHFIFNVMNVIRYMIKKEPQKAQEMVYDLALFMRGKIAGQTEEEPVLFSQEWNYVKAYLRLEQVSYPNLQFESECVFDDIKINPGSFLEKVEQLVKEQVRTTRQTRTISVVSNRIEDVGIEVGVKEIDLWIPL